MDDVARQVAVEATELLTLRFNIGGAFAFAQSGFNEQLRLSPVLAI